MEKLKEIFELKDIVWFVLGIAVPSVYNFFKKKINSWRMKRRIKKNDLHFRDSEIVSLAHGDPFFKIDGKNQDIDLRVPKDCFHIDIPKEIESQILEENPKFSNVTWEPGSEFLDNQSEDEMLDEVAKVLELTKEEMRQIYQEEKENIANLFLEKVKTGQPYFNGEMYGIKKLQQMREGAQETPSICIHSYKTDYYTHRVMAAIYKRVYAMNESIMPGTDIERYNKMRYFLTSMGMNVLLILNDEELVVFAKRSGKLINMKKPLWHVSMNEAISITDISSSSKGISLEKCIRRGLNEELGLDEDIPVTINYSDVFFLKNPFETGISAFVELDNFSFSKLKNEYCAAKDKELETEELKAVTYNEKNLGKFVKENELTDASEYLVEMLLARHIKGAI